MSKTVFDQLMEKLDEVILGRRYIIAEIGKLKEIVSETQDTSIGDAISQITGAVNEMKNFMQNSINSLTDLKNNITNLSTSVNSLNSTVETTLTSVNALKSGGIPASSSSAAPTPSPTISSSSSSASKPAPKTTAPAPAAPKASASSSPSPAPSSATSGGGGGDFDAIMSAANSKSPAVELGNMIDELRTKLSKENPLNPILFELSMESGRLKALGDAPLNENNLNTLIQKLNKWKAS